MIWQHRDSNASPKKDDITGTGIGNMHLKNEYFGLSDTAVRGRGNCYSGVMETALLPS